MEALLINGSVKNHLVKQTIPMIWGILAIMSFNLIDIYFIAKLGLSELTAISFTFPIVLIYANLGFGLSVGTTSVISKMVGEGKIENTRKFAINSIVFSFICVVIFVVLGFFTIKPTFHLMGATREQIILIEDYMQIWYLGMPFLIIPMIANAIIRSLGNTKTPALIMILVALVNIVLDPILIFGWGAFSGFGIEGAALATVVARAIAFLASASLLYFKYKITPSNFSFCDIFNCWKQIIKVAFPTSLTKLMYPLSMAVITALIAKFGTEAVAAFGVASKIEAFCLIVLTALSTAIGPFVGQNWGAKKYERALYAMKLSNQFSLFWGGLSFIIIFFARFHIISLFNNNPRVLEIAGFCLLLLSLSYAFEGMRVINSSFFYALSRPLVPVKFSVYKMVIIYIPFAYLFSRIYGVNGIFWAAFMANIISGIISFMSVKKCCLNRCT